MVAFRPRKEDEAKCILIQFRPNLLHYLHQPICLPAGAHQSCSNKFTHTIWCRWAHASLDQWWGSLVIAILLLLLLLLLLRKVG
jgi:hypothetical protein